MTFAPFWGSFLGNFPMWKGLARRPEKSDHSSSIIKEWQEMSPFHIGKCPRKRAQQRWLLLFFWGSFLGHFPMWKGLVRLPEKVTFFSNYQEMSRNNKQYQGISEKYQETWRNIKNIQKSLRHIKKYRDISTNMKKYQEIPKKYQDIWRNVEIK